MLTIDMIKYHFALLYFIVSLLYSSAGAVCPDPTEVDETALTKTIRSCGFQKKLALDPLVKETHRKLINEKLAEKVATQIKQNSEEFSLLVSFFDGKKSIMDSDLVHQQCKLEKLKKIECKNPINNNQKEKIELITNNFSKEISPHFKNESSPLYSAVATKFYSDLGLRDDGGKLTCPLDSSLGIFSLQAQLDDNSAEEIISKLNAINVDADSSAPLFDEYPQLKLIKSTQNETFINEFKIKMRSKPKNISAKEYITSFFLDGKNQKILEIALADQCSRMNENITNFVCNDLDDLGSLDDKVSKALFSRLGVKESLNEQPYVKIDKPGVLTAYGMQCLAKEKRLAENSKKLMPLDEWYNNFTDRTRPEAMSKDQKDDYATEFCSLYQCTNDKVKNTNSCKSGGPISSAELSQIAKCKVTPRDENCTPQIAKAVSFLEKIEKLKANAAGKTGNNLAIKGDNKKMGHLPSFAENYLGIEGTLKAIGQEVTPITIAEKKRDIEERKVASISSTSLSTAPAPAIAQQAKQVTPTSSSSEQSEANIQTTTPTYAPTTAQATSFKSLSPSSSNAKSAAVENKIQPAASSASAQESSRLRAEMEKMVQEMNANKEATATAEAVSPGKTSPNSNKAGKLQASNDSGSAEEERLKRWDKSLNDKAREIDEDRRELDNRYKERNRGVAQDDTSSSGGSSIRSGGSSGSGGDSSSGSSALSLSSAKLAAAGSKGDPKNNSAAIVQSGKETSAITAEELSKLSPDALKNLGIDSTKPFTLVVKLNEKKYEVQVDTNIVYKGSRILGPIIDPKNKDLKDFLMKSPLFKSYKEYRLERGSMIDI